MASSATSTPLSLSSSSTAKAPPPPPPPLLPRQLSATATSSSPSQRVTLAPPVHQSSRLWKTSTYCRKIVRNVAAMATTGEAPPTVATTTIEVEETVDLPDFVKTLQDTWDKVDNKYAVTSLGVAGFVGLWASAGMISAIDRLPLVPGVLELVGIGYTGWFVYKNMIFKPEREALIQKIKDIYEDIIGTS